MDTQTPDTQTPTHPALNCYTKSWDSMVGTKEVLLAYALALLLLLYLESRTDLSVLDSVVAVTCLIWIGFSTREKWDWVLWITAIATILAIGVTLSWVYWEVLHGDQDSVSTTFRNLGLLIGGAIAILLAVWRSVVAERQADTASESLLNERYQKGAEMLGDEVLSVRLGGIHALESLAAEHPEQYHLPIMKLFCAFVRNPTAGEVTADSLSESHSLREDVQEVITAISSRSQAGLEYEKKENFRLQLHDSDLRHANLRHANLTRANLSGTDLTDAILFEADMSGAVLTEANLTRADATHANLHRANLSKATLHYTDLSGAVFGERADHTKHSVGLTDFQLNLALASRDNPPLLDGVVDDETGQPLVWRGEPCQ